ncbi:Peptidase M48 [Corchorus olitorius]|uniref:Peptidase M48 n=1 Tax=Corchorus olitorius TaxID=93759 RepID=A0A1R3KRP0_9ROSI|nr:Peptidase M48 [Corchorus olitorius]
MLMASARYDPQVAPYVYENRLDEYDLSLPFPAQQRVSLGLLQNLTSKFKPQWPQTLLLSRTSFTGFNVVSIATVPGGAARLSYSRGGFAQATRRFYHSNRNLASQINKSTTQTQKGLGVCLLSRIRLERIPYTERLHLTLSTGYEKALSKRIEKKMLPPSDPRVIRVQSIAENLINGLKQGLILQGEPRLDSENSKSIPNLTKEYDSTAVSGHMREGNYRQKRRWKPAIKHLEGKGWEFYVADKDKINAYCHPNGKIVINSGLLKHLKSDDEIATILAHELSHILLVILVDNFFSRRMEAEADYIGLMLMASAGYDPQVAPNLYQNQFPLMFPGIGPNVYEYLDYWFSFALTHHSGKKRAKLLKEPRTMELAKQVYEDAKAGNPITRGLLRVENGVWIQFSKSVGRCDVNEAEVLAIKEVVILYGASRWAQSHGLIVESDSSNAFKWVTNPESGPWEIRKWLSLILAVKENSLAFASNTLSEVQMVKVTHLQKVE